jgi:hypothetical protein
LRCKENYEYTKEGDEYVRKVKECNDQTSFSNGSCQLKKNLAVKKGSGLMLFVERE